MLNCNVLVFVLVLYFINYSTQIIAGKVLISTHTQCNVIPVCLKTILPQMMFHQYNYVQGTVNPTCLVFIDNTSKNFTAIFCFIYVRHCASTERLVWWSVNGPRINVSPVYG